MSTIQYCTLTTLSNKVSKPSLNHIKCLILELWHWHIQNMLGNNVGILLPGLVLRVIDPFIVFWTHTRQRTWGLHMADMECPTCRYRHLPPLYKSQDQPPPRLVLPAELVDNIGISWIHPAMEACRLTACLADRWFSEPGHCPILTCRDQTNGGWWER